MFAIRCLPAIDDVVQLATSSALGTSSQPLVPTKRVPSPALHEYTHVRVPLVGRKQLPRHLASTRLCPSRLENGVIAIEAQHTPRTMFTVMRLPAVHKVHDSRTVSSRNTVEF